MEAQGREQWGTRVGFILAAVGSAIGLGNIWRFPYMAYENGGGAFLIPYFFALLTAGIAIMILEFGIGHKYRGAAPATFAAINKNWEWLGWLQTLVAFCISVYYVVIIGWAISYFYMSFGQGWGDDPKGFFFENFLHLTEGPFQLGCLVWPILGATLIAWLINWIVLYSGVRRGIEVANKIFMPILFVLVLVMLVRGVTLPGAAEGLNWLFRPDFSAIWDYRVWADAYGQIFFSLSIAFAIMITYSSYLPKKSDIVNNAFMTSLINCGFSMLAGIAVFSILGYMAAEQGKAIQDVAGAGVGLAFVTFPQAINLLPAASFFGALFFLSLTFAGLSSEISINEAVISALMDKYGWSRKVVATWFCIVGFVISLFFVTGGGLYLLDIVDHFINNFGIVFGGLIEVILLSWFFNLESVRKHINAVSDFAAGAWWKFCLQAVTPIVLGYMAIANLIGDIREPYSGYPVGALIAFGWVVVVGVVVAAFILQASKGKGRMLDSSSNL
ncbi:MAG: sodium-dependent transporter [Peptococcaceae bacterium]|nr:sodium-dependent transporter [Peptococcaceae bacterium]MBO8128736.1 sodium-dependent transporter [Peptococcaceae bacterium]